MGYLWIFFDFFIKGIVFYIFLDILLLITFLSVIREGDNDETKKYICRAAHYGKILWVTELHFDRTSRGHRNNRDTGGDIASGIAECPESRGCHQLHLHAQAGRSLGAGLYGHL